MRALLPGSPVINAILNSYVLQRSGLVRATV